MRKRDILLKIIIYALYLLLFYLLQAAVFPRLAILGVKPLILPVAVVGAALYEGSFTGAVLGLFAGLLCDVSMAGSAALFTVALTVIGAGVGLLSEGFLTRSLLSLALCALGALALCAFLQAFGFIFYRGASISAVAITALRQTAYSIVFSIPVWGIARAISGRFRKAEL